jgi:TonB family protein
MRSLRALSVLGCVLFLPQQTPPPPSRPQIPRIELQVDDKGADVAPWARDFILLVDRNWSMPAEAATIQGHVGLTFNVSRDGKISDLAVLAPAAADVLNTAVKDAIAQASLAQSTPSNYPDDRMPVAVTAYYNEAPPRATIPKVDPPPGVYAPSQGNGITTPRVTYEEKPHYTSDAMRARVQGAVVLGCVVDVDGSVRDVKVLASLDRWLGLDAEAIRAATQWKFTPGIRSGEAVPVWITIQMAFTLK